MPRLHGVLKYEPLQAALNLNISLVVTEIQQTVQRLVNSESTVLDSTPVS